jgi:hypothetical protein
MAASSAIITTQYPAAPSREEIRSQLAQESAAVPTTIAASGAAHRPTNIEGSSFIVIVLAAGALATWPQLYRLASQRHTATGLPVGGRERQC